MRAKCSQFLPRVSRQTHSIYHSFSFNRDDSGSFTCNAICIMNGICSYRACFGSFEHVDSSVCPIKRSELYPIFPGMLSGKMFPFDIFPLNFLSDTNSVISLKYCGYLVHTWRHKKKGNTLLNENIPTIYKVNPPFTRTMPYSNHATRLAGSEFRTLCNQIASRVFSFDKLSFEKS